MPRLTVRFCCVVASVGLAVIWLSELGFAVCSKHWSFFITGKDLDIYVHTASFLGGSGVFWQPAEETAFLAVRPPNEMTAVHFPQVGARPGIAGLRIPLWILTVTAIVATSVLLYSWRSQPIRSACRFCGYDLRGTLAEKCPECGSSRATCASKLKRAREARVLAGSVALNICLFFVYIMAIGIVPTVMSWSVIVWAYPSEFTAESLNSNNILALFLASLVTWLCLAVLAFVRLMRHRIGDTGPSSQDG